MNLSAEDIRQQALALGFNMVGITRAVPSPTLDAYLRWIEQGMYGSMGYLARADRVARRVDPRVILPSAQTFIVVGLDYGAAVSLDLLNDPTRGRIAAYAWGADYHDIMTPRLDAFAQQLRRQVPLEFAVYVDTGAILERSHAQQAGLGFVGKNTMLIHPRRGSSFFLAEIILSAEVDAYDAPHRATMCGSCTRCLNACPTDAFPQPHVLDARRCISYHTIENKGSIPAELRASFGNWVYGCDVCQDVCPFQRFASETHERAFLPIDESRIAPPLADLLTMSADEFTRQFAGSALLRIKHDRLLRNACIAAGNSRERALVPLLQKLLAHENTLVQECAAWAAAQLGG